MNRLFLLLFTVACLAGPVLAADPQPSPSASPDSKPGQKAAEAPSPEEKPKESKGSVQIGGTSLAYAVKTGMLPVFKDDGSVRANVFYVYYSVADSKNAPSPAEGSHRPITFCFNGGPGASAVWLHLGGLGPKRVDIPGDLSVTSSATSSTRVVDNPSSILDATDLIFVDPVATGLSRAAKGEKPEQFFGVDEDIESVGEFVRLFTTRENRWSSPKFLCGESYGGIRVAGLAEYLQDRHAMNFAGVIFLSALLDFQTLAANTGNDLPFVLALPGFTATALYHHKLAPELQANFDRAISESRAFAQGDYVRALLKGSALEPAERQRVAAQIARLTGLDPGEMLACDLRLSPDTFRSLLFRKEGKLLGRFDGRVTTESVNQLSIWPDFDPALAFVIGDFSAAVNSYVRNDLGYESDTPYRVLTPLDWRYHGFANRYVSKADNLARVLRQNPAMRLLFLCGERDLAIPPDAIRYSFDHLPIPASLRANATFASYESGHMMYLDPRDASQLRRDLVDFIHRASP